MNKDGFALAVLLIVVGILAIGGGVYLLDKKARPTSPAPVIENGDVQLQTLFPAPGQEEVTTVNRQVQPNIVTADNASGLSYLELRDRLKEANTVYFLDINNPVVSVYFQRPLNPATVNAKTVLARWNGQYLVGRTVSYKIEEGRYQDAVFPMYKIEIDLKTVNGLRNFLNKDIEFLLTKDIKDTLGKPLEQCVESYNRGQCIPEEGPKLQVYGFRVRLFDSSTLVR